MNKPICKDVFILSRKSTPATRDDLDTARDLLDTLRTHIDHCAGMAANMIGVNKRIIAVSLNGFPIVMINPVITKKSSETYDAEEGCLSLSGQRKTIRHQSVEVEFLDMSFQPHRQTYTGWTAQVIQHEVDHCEGILI